MSYIDKIKQKIEDKNKEKELLEDRKHFIKFKELNSLPMKYYCQIDTYTNKINFIFKGVKWPIPESSLYLRKADYTLYISKDIYPKDWLSSIYEVTNTITKRDNPKPICVVDNFTFAHNFHEPVNTGIDEEDLTDGRYLEFDKLDESTKIFLNINYGISLEELNNIID